MMCAALTGSAFPEAPLSSGGNSTGAVSAAL
jgi:hypothetical protein